MKEYFLTLLLILTLHIFHTHSQVTPMIETRKYSAVIGEERGITISQAGQNYNVPFLQLFQVKPQLGLSIYNMQYQYDPKFSVSIVRLTQQSFTMQIAGISSLIDNQIYIMYFATTYNQIGVFVPEIQETPELNRAERNSQAANRTQTLIYDFKTIGQGTTSRPIFDSQVPLNDISLTIYLNGIISTSENTNNGYAKNYTYFSLRTRFNDTKFYQVLIEVRSTFGDVTIQNIQFTTIYFRKSTVLQNFQMIGETVSSGQFGGQFYKSVKPKQTVSLSYDNAFDNSIQFFFGISKIQCFSGQSINLLAVQSFKFNTLGQLQSLILTFETEKYTFIQDFSYNYVLYKKKACFQQSCGVICDDPTKPSFKASDTDAFCIPCFYQCASCNDRSSCTKCPDTRLSSQDNSAFCSCANATLYDDFISLECQTCFDHNFCRQCERKQVCLNCYTENNFILNQVLTKCQCAPSYYLDPQIVASSSLPLVKRIAETCAKCPQYCIYCTGPLSCEACQVKSYLLSNAVSIGNRAVSCAEICDEFQIYNKDTFKCSQYTEDQSLFNQEGRLGFQWDYSVSSDNKNQIIIDMLFSQRNISAFYYENGQANYFQQEQSAFNPDLIDSQTNFFYDDGRGYISGYTRQDQSTIIDRSGMDDSGQASAGSNIFDPSALRGQYYGLGEATFFRQEYQKYEPQAAYFDEFGIPFGKHKLNNITYNNQNYAEAVRRNLVFKIGDEVLPYTLNPISANEFQLIVNPEKSYLMKNATIAFKNPALIRSGNTTLQTPEKTIQLDRLDYYPQALLASSQSLKNRTLSIVQILWGICKYILFVGFGWTVMPLMLILQFIHGLNYINTQLPVNLDEFLSSFKDFKNPSILFDPERKNFDRQVVNHPQIYKKVQGYQEFDEGIDFMKNSFQLFFTPLLSFGLLFLLIGLNCLFRLCKRDFTLVSKYLAPRAGLHAGAYTLVQALPVSFFFFGQLSDTRYHSVNSPNAIYPSFNAGISFASFFASIIIPMIILTGLYQLFNRNSKVSVFKKNKLFNQETGKGTFNNTKCMSCPLWGGKPSKIASYIFGGAVFMLPLLLGFFLAQFSRNYPWQITGLLVFTILFFAFAASSRHFDNPIPKIYFVVSSILMIGYVLLHAGIGSNRALSTVDQWNIGYLGIGILYALILTALLFSIYLIFKTLNCILTNIIKPRGCFPKYDLREKKTEVDEKQGEDQEAARNVATKRELQRKKNNLRSYINLDPPSSQQRMLNRDSNFYVGAGNADSRKKDNLFRQILFYDRPGTNGFITYVGGQSKQKYIFPPWSAQILSKEKALTIDSNDNIYRGNSDNLIGTYEQLRKEQQPSNWNIIRRVTTRQFESENEADLGRYDQAAYQRIIVNGETLNYIQDQDQMIIVKTGDGKFHRLSLSEFQKLRRGEIRLGEEGPLIFAANRDGTANRVISQPSLLHSQNNSEDELIANRLHVQEEEIYTINGQDFKKIGFENGKIVLQSKRTGSKKYISQKQLVGSRQQIGSQQVITKVMLETGNMYEIYGDSLLFKGMEGSQYIFINQSTKKRIQINENQLTKIVRSQGFKKKESNSALLIESNKNYRVESRKVIKKNILTYVGVGEEPDTHQFRDENDEVYEIGGVDPRYEAFFDELGNIWQNNRIVITREEMEGQEEPVVYDYEQKAEENLTHRRISMRSITSNNEFNMQEILKPGEHYRLVILNPSYKQIGDGYNYSQRDIITTLGNIRSEDVENEIQRMSNTYKGIKIILENKNNSKQRYFIDE